MKKSSLFLSATLLCVSLGCARTYPKHQVELHTFEAGAEVSLAQVRSHPAGVDTVEGMKLWKPVEPGKLELEEGSYFYLLKLKDGRKKQGLVAVLESGPILLK